MSEDVRVNRRVTIPGSELAFRFSPSGGPGGQHANRSNTRVELVWNLDGSDALGPRQKARVRRRLRTRVEADGSLRVVADEHRSQAQNRREALARLAGLVAAALEVPKQRVPTRPSRASQRRRVDRKRRRGETKRLRRPPAPD